MPEIWEAKLQRHWCALYFLIHGVDEASPTQGLGFLRVFICFSKAQFLVIGVPTCLVPDLATVGTFMPCVCGLDPCH
jgi:hypothetical protein